MRILAVGGGSGGHVTPVVAVLKEIRAKQPKAELRVWVDRHFAPQATSIVEAFDSSIPVHTIIAGKFRRYHHVSVVRQLFWPSLVVKNVRDMFFVVLGIKQSFFKLLIWRPDVVFTKGGFVCLPVGIAARILRIPLVIHDSDAHPGLTNRILSRWATMIATGAPLEYYPYPREKSTYVGIPVADVFKPYSARDQRRAKQEWGIDPSRPLLVVTGGGQGAKRINDTVVEVLKRLQKEASVVLVAGAGQFDELRAKLPADSEHFQLYSFVSNMHSLLGAADVVVTRAGATTILELAALAKPTILIPNAKLTGGHQLKNAVVYEEAEAVRVINEEAMMSRPQLLVEAVKDVLDHPAASKRMATRFQVFAKPNAAKDMAALILKAAQ